jgi:hypothetical protein
MAPLQILFDFKAGTVDFAVRAQTLNTLIHHRAILEANGIATISDLGTLNLSGHLLAPRGKIVYAPPPAAGNPAVTVVAGSGSTPLSVMHAKLGGSTGHYFEAGPLFAQEPTGQAVLTPRPGAAIPLDVAYFCASVVNIAPNTYVELKPPHKYLTFIAEELNVGDNVCALHCCLLSLWFLKQSRLAGFDLDTQAASPAVADVDGGEFAALDLMQNGLLGYAERGGCLV